MNLYYLLNLYHLITVVNKIIVFLNNCISNANMMIFRKIVIDGNL